MKNALVLALLSATHLFAATGGLQSLPAIPNGGTVNVIRIDPAGSLYLAGTASNHAFVAKLSSDASQVIWWTTLAGSVSETAGSLTLAADGSVYALGATQSTDFPTTAGVLQATGPAGSNFAVKLDSKGAVVYSTYLPMSSVANAAVDPTGRLFLTGGLKRGETLQATPGTVGGTTLGNPGTFNFVNAYIMEIDAAGAKALLTIVGYGGVQVALDAQGNIYALGAFNGPQAPTTAGAFQTTAPAVECVSNQLFGNSCREQHIAKIDPTGTHLIWATYLTGGWDAAPIGMVLDSNGNVIVAGNTQSPDYPTTPDAFQPEYPANPASIPNPGGLSAPHQVGYVSKLNASGTGLIWSTFFGGSTGNADILEAFAVDPNGNIGMLGDTTGNDIPGLWNIPVAARQAPANQTFRTIYLTRLSADGTTIQPVQETNNVFQIAMRSDGSAVVAGTQLFNVTYPQLGRVLQICDSADEAEIVTVAPGQLLSIYGTNLAPASGVPAGFPATFNGVTVTFNGIAAPILYAAGNQINVQAPYEIAGQTQVTMAVASTSVTPAVSESYYLGVVARQPSVFVDASSFNGPLFDQGTCQGQTISGLQPLAFNADGTLNSCAHPAVAASNVMVILNGMGVTTPAQKTGTLASAATAITPAASVHQSTALPTQTLANLISSVAAVQVPAPATSSVVYLSLLDTSTIAARGPGVVIWVK